MFRRPHLARRRMITPSTPVLKRLRLGASSNAAAFTSSLTSMPARAVSSDRPKLQNAPRFWDQLSHKHFRGPRRREAQPQTRDDQHGKMRICRRS
jgi:hypothetical protein